MYLNYKFMSTLPTASRHLAPKIAPRRRLYQMVRYLRLIFFSGPKVLLTSRISGRCAVVMTLLCLPSLLFSFILTVPGLIFQSPHQHAYFYFSKVINEDPTRWVALSLAGVCALIALAIPATMVERNHPIRY